MFWILKIEVSRNDNFHVGQEVEGKYVVCTLNFFSIIYSIDVIHSVKNKNSCRIKKKKKIKNILVTFWVYTDNNNKWLIYPHTFLYIIIILTYRKIYFHLYTIGKKMYYEKSKFSLVA